MLHFTCAAPSSVELQDDCGLPLGLVAQPLARPDGAAPTATCWAADLARCSRCLAFINALCDVDDHGWACALCGCTNDFASAANLRRYYGGGSRRGELPELSPGPLDALCPLLTADPDEGTDEVLALEAQPAVLALVDTTCGGEELELVKSALVAAVEALPPAARFGVVSFGSAVGLHQVGGRGGRRLVEHVTMEGEEGSHADLGAAAPLGSVLASVGASKAAILAAIEGLEAEPPVGGGAERLLGDTLRAVLRWIATGAADAAQSQHEQSQQQQQHGMATVAPQQQQLQQEQEEAAEEEARSEASTTASGLPAAQGFPSMRLLLFLGGPPNGGPGSVVARRAPSVDPAAAAAAAQAAAEEAAKELAQLMLDPAYPELSAWTDDAGESAAARAQAAAEAAAAVQAAAGDLSHAAPPGVPAALLGVNPGAARFYAEAGAAAAALSMSVDVFAISPKWMGLEMIEPLAAASGGTVLLYTSLDGAALPQDVYKCVARSRAFACMLRLRTSPELRVEGCHGRLVPDRQAGVGEHSDLWRLVGCGPEDAFAFNLGRTTQRAACAAPAVQLVLQYSMLVPALPAAEGEAPGSRYVLHRFMRVITAAMPMVSQPSQLYDSCDVDATACLAVHKALECAAEKGVAAARQMLYDWLVLLAARSADLLGRRGKADASLAHIATLQQLPHLLYALLHGPLLQLPAAVMAAAEARRQQQQQQQQQHVPWQQHPDGPAALRALLRQLPPDELAVAVCPQLASWSGPDEVAVLHHSLSKAALAVGQQPLWVLDAWQQLIVLYAEVAGAAAPPPFPLPADSQLRGTIAGIRRLRRFTPELLILRQGMDDTSAFDAWLLEDAAQAELAAAAAAGQRQQQRQWEWPTFVHFVNTATRAAQDVLERHRSK